MQELDKMTAHVERAESLKGQYLRNTRDQTVWKVTDVGREGVTVYQVEGYGLDTFGPETTLTWVLVQAIYAVMVHAGELEVKGEH